MCGICGYISSKKIEDERLELMRDTMYHRGPNDAGIWQCEKSNGYVGLAHRRLSIFDLSELGHQPMQSFDGRFSIVFNGEVYNFKRIRKELIEYGYAFKSNCDTEVILYAFEEWGMDCFSKFNGMFAIALWDKSSEELVIARDRMGVKPLYYYWNAKTNDFVFASELKPIIKYPYFHKKIDENSLGTYLCHKYIPAPKTIFLDTYKLEAGTYAVFKNDTITVKKYWDIVTKKRECDGRLISNFYEAKEELNNLLIDAVDKRMEADVPVGTFLSSGIDSALITAIAQRNSPVPIKTFTIGFYERERNEANKAKKIAEFLGTDHTELYIGEKEIFSMIDNITQYYDEPFADASQLPTMLVSKLASDYVTVALSGDGGDELFCGYNMYDLVYIAQKFDFIGNILHCIPSITRIVSPEVRAFINNRNTDNKTQLFTDVIYEPVQKILLKCEDCPKHINEKSLKYNNWQERRMLLDMMTYLPDEIMAKTDRASMKYSLEVRSPLLDYRLVEKSFEIPHDFKYHFFEKKYILRKMAYDYLPSELLDGPKKGFGVPLAKWLRGPLQDEIKQYSDPVFLQQQGIFNSKCIEELINIQYKDNKVIYSNILWAFYMFQRWYKEYLM